MRELQKVSKQSFFTIDAKRLELGEELIIILGDTLNKIHRTNYSHRFWKIIIAPYVSTVLTSRGILERENLKISPGLILHANTLEMEKKSMIFSKVRYLIKFVKSYRIFLNFNSQFRVFRNIAIGLHPIDDGIPGIDVYLKTLYPYIWNKKVNTEKRNVPLNPSPNFSEVFIQNMIKCIPKIYVENFDTIINKVRLYNPAERIFHVAVFQSHFMRFIVAKYVENGAQLYFYQHGGFYGEYKHHTAHNFESSIADKFMTWGWKIKESDVPSKAYRLEKFSKDYVVNSESKYDILIIYPIIRNQNSVYVKEASKVFFDRINREKFTDICVRPRPSASFNRKAILNFVSLDATKIDSGFTNIAHLISSSNLVIIFTHPSMTLLECLYVNQPVVAIIDNDNESTNVVKPHYDYLLNQGLLHTSMDSLIEHLNKVDIKLWWTDLIKQEGYQNFKHEFLRKV